MAISSLCALCTGCFTGVESTKTITMSRGDIKNAAPSKEEQFLSDIPPSPLGEWNEGKRFYVADDKLAYLLVQRSLGYNIQLPHRGDTLRFTGTSLELQPDGKETVAIRLRGVNGEYLLDTHLSLMTASTQFTSGSSEALIDIDALEALRHKMKDQQFWTRSAVWYDRNGDNFKGAKYVPITITEIEPGNIIFPIKVSFSDKIGNTGSYFMNLWKGSRSFQTLFSLDDVKNRYPQIDEEVWELICQEKVRNGMTKQECRLALGNPLDSDSGRTYTSTVDVWMYDGGRYLKFENGILIEHRL